jgi:hypothetical protein
MKVENEHEARIRAMELDKLNKTVGTEKIKSTAAVATAIISLGVVIIKALV